MAETTSTDAYALLREAILTGALQPAERLVEADLTTRFAVSRGAVRTALVRLQQEGLVEHERHRGARVRLVDEHEAAEILEARMVLEGLAARHAATRATPDEVAELRAIVAGMGERLADGDLLGASDRNAILHARLLAIAGHATVARLVAGLRGQLVRFQYRTILVPGRSERSLAEHTALVDAIAAGDPDAAEAAMRAHLGHVAQALRATREVT